jgi:adenylylsulfate reductase subunit A
MAPSQTLKWIESGKMPSQENVELEGTEPYIVGGHTGSGYWIDTGRRTTLRGLYAAGDVAGGAPKKFVSGALAEGKLAVVSALEDLPRLTQAGESAYTAQEDAILADYDKRLSGKTSPYPTEQLEEAMQKVMDAYAGGLGTGYRYNERQLHLAEDKIASLEALSATLTAADTDGLLHIYELTDRLTVCRVLLAHLLARKETRWPGFGIRTDYPEKDESWGEKYVNSQLVNGELRVFTRDLVKGDGCYEHSNRER